MGGLCVEFACFEAMGCTTYALVAEQEPDCALCLATNWPQAVLIDKVEQVTAAMVAPVLQKRSFSCVVVGGGSPCQPNSQLNPQRKGLQDARALQPYQLERLIRELQALPEMKEVPCLAYLENVAGAPPEVVAAYSAIAGKPVRTSASLFGYAYRKRLWFGRGPRAEVADAQQAWLPECLRLEGATKPLLCWGWGKPKPHPNRVHLEDGFLFAFDPAEVVKSGGKGAMHTLCREFKHPRI